MSQTAQILEYLKQGNSITALEALERFGCMRLAARIADLREAGYSIATITVSRNDKKFASYRLIKVAAA